MKHIKCNLIMFLLVLYVVGAVHATSTEEDDDITKITKEEVQKIIGQPDVTLIDVRYEKNWKKSDRKIAGATREHPNEIGSWVGKYTKDHKLILYCD
jgi:rhodanese-related sulfurtransferase